MSKPKDKKVAEAAYMKAMAKLYQGIGRPDLAKSYEMGAYEVFTQPAPKGNPEQ